MKVLRFLGIQPIHILEGIARYAPMCAPKNQPGQEIGILSTLDWRIECALPNYGFVGNQFRCP